MKEVAYVRSIVNQQTIRARLMRDKKGWLELCVGMDVIEDTASAHNAYIENLNVTAKGSVYLMIYGALQCAVVQQDAMEALCKTIGYSFRVSEFPRLSELRKLRNMSVGHPVNSDRADKRFSHHFMIQVTMTPESFILSSHGTGGLRSTNVELATLLAEQNTVIRESLRKAAAMMVKNEQEHREKFRSEKLSAIFEPTTYAMQKVFEAAWNPEHLDLGKAFLPTLNGCLAAFLEAIGKRDIDVHAYHGIDNAMEKLKFPMERLAAIFAGDETYEPRLVEIFADYVERKFYDLKEGARLIDRQYESDKVE